MSRETMARRVLDALDSGAVAKRPTPPPRGVVQRLCRNAGCNVQIIVAPLAGGNWAALERHPEGDIVLHTGIAITRGPTHVGLDRYCFHGCAKEKRHG